VHGYARGWTTFAKRPRKHDQEQTIRRRASWALDLTMDDDELLSQQGVLSDAFGLAASEISERSSHWRAIGWLRPLKQALVRATGPVMD
jgi:hypothetical protein